MGQPDGGKPGLDGHSKGAEQIAVRAAGYTPKDFDMNRIMGDRVSLIEKRADEKAA